jgi:hypothetical protein
MNTDRSTEHREATRRAPRSGGTARWIASTSANTRGQKAGLVL